MIDKDWLRKFSKEDLEGEPTVIGPIADEDDLPKEEMWGDRFLPEVSEEGIGEPSELPTKSRSVRNSYPIDEDDFGDE